MPNKPFFLCLIYLNKSDSIFNLIASELSVLQMHSFIMIIVFKCLFTCHIPWLCFLVAAPICWITIWGTLTYVDALIVSAIWCALHCAYICKSIYILQVYCSSHVPKSGPGHLDQTAVGIRQALNAPRTNKFVNEQIRGTRTEIDGNYTALTTLREKCRATRKLHYFVILFRSSIQVVYYFSLCLCIYLDIFDMLTIKMNCRCPQFTPINAQWLRGPWGELPIPKWFRLQIWTLRCKCFAHCARSQTDGDTKGL